MEPGDSPKSKFKWRAVDSYAQVVLGSGTWAKQGHYYGFEDYKFLDSEV